MDSEAEDTKFLVATSQPDLSTPSKKKKKKRKRELVQANIRVIPDNPEKAPPLVGYFPSEFAPLENKDEDGRDSVKVKVLRHKGKPKRLQLMVSPNGQDAANIDFVGTNYSGEAEAGQLCNYALGVLDKATQTLKILPIASNKIFRLEPKVKVREVEQVEQPMFIEEEEGELSAKKKGERIRDLTQLYGTKRARNQAKKLDAMKLQIDPDSQKDLNETIEKLVTNKDALGTETHKARNIPPHNLVASSPEQAYPLDQIIVEGDHRFLLDVYQHFQKGEVVWTAYPKFISNRVHKLGDIEDEEEKKRLSNILTYITHLIKFKDQHSMDGFSSAKRHNIPDIFRHRFSAMFTDQELRRLPAEKLNLLISYVLVLTLHVDEFRTNYTDIANDLKLSTITLREHYERLGCKFSQHQNQWLAHLPLPLQFPQVRQRRRRR